MQYGGNAMENAMENANSFSFVNFLIDDIL